MFTKRKFSFFSLMLVLVLVLSTVQPASAATTPTVKQPTISKVATASDGTSAKITWKKVSGADGYRLYRKDPSDTKWVKVASTAKTSYTDKKFTATEGKKVQYMVKAYVKAEGKTYWSKASDTKKWTVPKKSTKEPEKVSEGYKTHVLPIDFYKAGVKYIKDKNGKVYDVTYDENNFPHNAELEAIPESDMETWELLGGSMMCSEILNVVYEHEEYYCAVYFWVNGDTAFMNRDSSLDNTEYCDRYGDWSAYPFE